METLVMKTTVMTGLDMVAARPQLLEDLGRVALVTNQAVTTSQFRPCAEVVAEAISTLSQSQLISVFGPQHGFYQTEQDNMLETPDIDIQLGAKRYPLFSLYSKTRVPTQEQLSNVDTIVVDLLDVGCRVYTYMLTLAGCMRQAALSGKRIVVLDRPNPQGHSRRNPKTGKTWGVEGHTLNMKWESFVGWYPIPMKHGLTMAELARYFVQHDDLKLDLKIIGGPGFVGNHDLASNRLHCAEQWTTPSPNLPTLNTALLFPSFVSLEGTNVSEGRGTTLPFQTVGAPFLNAQLVVEDLKWIQKETNGKEALSFQDVAFRRQDFRPTFNKHKGEWCQGLQFHPLFRDEQSAPEFNSFALGVFFLSAVALRHGDLLRWKDPGYEYNHTDNPMNLIYGDSRYLEHFEALRSRAGSNASLGTQARQHLLESTSSLLFEAQKSADRFFEATQFACTAPV